MGPCIKKPHRLQLGSAIIGFRVGGLGFGVGGLGFRVMAWGLGLRAPDIEASYSSPAGSHHLISGDVIGYK